MDFLRTYLGYIRLFFKGRMEYRFSFFAGMFSNFFCYFITYCTFWVLTSKFDSIAGWNFDEMSILYGLNLLTYATSGLFYWYTIYHLSEEIISGRIDIYLLRPMGVIKQMVCQRFGDTFIGQIVVTVIFMVSAISKISYQMTVFSYIYLIFAILSGVLIQSGAMILLGSLNFWTMRANELSGFLYYDIRTLIHYPLDIFPQGIQILLTFVLPWALINYYPSLLILNKVQTPLELIVGLCAPVFGVLFFALSVKVFNIGLRRYSGTGS